jgi:hypothetical protein
VEVKETMDLFSTAAGVAALCIWAWVFVTVVDRFLIGAKVMAEINGKKSKKRLNIHE